MFRRSMKALRQSEIASIIRQHPARSATLIGILFLTGTAEGFGLLTVLPLLDALGGDPRPGSTAGRIVTGALAAVGLPRSPGVLLLVLALALVLKGVLRWAAMVHVADVVAETAEDLRLRLVRGLLAAKWDYVAGQAPGRVATALTRDAQWAATAYRNACSVTAAAIQLGVYFIAIMLVSGWLGALAAAMTALLGFLLARWIGESRRAGTAQVRRARRFSARVLDVLRALKPIRTMGREGGFLLRLRRDARSLRSAERAQVVAAEGLRSFQEPLVAVLLAVGVYAAVAWGSMELPVLVMVALLLQRMGTHMHAIQVEYQSTVAAAAALRALRVDIERAEAAREQRRGRVRAPAAAPRLVLDNVGIRRDGRWIVRALSCSVPAGEIMALVGPSGSGKTSVLDALAGLIAVDEGEILVDGVPLGETRTEWRSRVGYVPQASAVLPGSIRGNVSFGGGVLAEERFGRSLTRAALGHLEPGRNARLLSGGEQRRVALARALAWDPLLVLLDEPTSELDEGVRDLVARSMAALRCAATVVIATHDASLVAMADHVVHVGTTIPAAASA